MPTIKILLITLLIFTSNFISQHSFAQITKLSSFGDNPGELSASFYAPNTNNPAIVVLLHGCDQQGEELAQQSGLLALAQQHNFALLLPQQSSSNNIKRCFNWYSAADYAKNKGESLSIKNMILLLKKQLASSQVYIIGLSGGGAMTSSMMIHYPEIFTAGAVVAGIPFPCADGLITAISCMKNGPSQTSSELVSLAKKLNPKQANWPKLSVWTGANDPIVNPLNSSSLAQQWAQLSQFDNPPVVTNKLGYTLTRWQDSQKEVQVELIEVAKLSHGIMVNPTVKNGGEVSDYLLASPVSTAKHLVDFWNL